MKKMRMMEARPAPMARKTAISAFLERTNMIIDEIILKAATKIISVKIKNMTLRSTAKALRNEAFLVCQS